MTGGTYNPDAVPGRATTSAAGRYSVECRASFTTPATSLQRASEQ